MSIFLRPLLALLLSPLAALAAEGWPTDLAAAKRQAEAERKDILVLFTGSDWCRWSQRLDREVFETTQFGAQKRFVLVQADFPQSKELPPSQVKANRELKEAWAVTGYPTVILANAAGEPYARTGYKPGGPEVYLEFLAFLSKRNTPAGLAIYRETPQQKAVREAAYKEKLIELVGKGDFEAIVAHVDDHFTHDDGGLVLAPFNKALMSQVLDPKNRERALPFIDEAIAQANKTGPAELIAMLRLKRMQIMRGE